MKNPFIQAAMLMAAMTAAMREDAIRNFNSNHRKGTRKPKFKSDDLPRGYAGAKLARKALAGRIGVCH